MEHFKKAIESINNMELRVSGNRIQQTDSSKVKAILMNALLLDLEEVANVTRVEKGILVEIPHEEEGVLFSLCDMVMQPLNTDVETLKQEYEQKIQAREEKAKKKQDKQKTTTSKK